MSQIDVDKIKQDPDKLTLIRTKGEWVQYIHNLWRPIPLDLLEHNEEPAKLPCLVRSELIDYEDEDECTGRVYQVTYYNHIFMYIEDVMPLVSAHKATIN